ncbi:MAG TPA: hypothetical protein VIG51_09315 [Candidatus Baltobacteraceae bacterium]|jgi:hypothetical protein
MALVEHPGWILLILCVAGVLIAGGSMIPVAVGTMRLLKHVERLLEAPILADLGALSAQTERITQSANAIAPLAERAAAAVEAIRRDARETGLVRVAAALRGASTAFRLLLADLR